MPDDKDPVNFTFGSARKIRDAVRDSRSPRLDLSERPWPRLFAYHFIKVMSAARDGSNFRWTYTIREVKRTATLFGAWTEISDDLTAFNSLEQMNGASGLMGNGVNTSDLSGTGLTLQPAPVGAIVRASFEFDAWVFSYANAISGSCDP
jgi:hypothetical protein